MFNLSGKNVVFVGGLGGICYEACKVLMSKNVAHLFVLDAVENANHIKALQALNPKTVVVYHKIDITDKSVIKRVVAEIVAKAKHIDVLVNGAGILSDRNVELTININLVGLVNMTLEALPYMDKKQHGHGGVVVNIASVLGLEPCPPVAVYSGSKFGVMGFTRSMAEPLYFAHTGVAFITFCPGLTDTPLKNGIIGRDTFDYSKPLSETFLAAASQKPSICGGHIVDAIETFENGTICISDLGTLKRVEPKVYWQMTFEK